MNFEDFDTEEKITALRYDLDQVMREMDMRSYYVSKAEMTEREREVEAMRERRKQRDEALNNLKV